MNKLDYCISLREKGLDSIEIKKRLKAEGMEESQIQYYFKKSDNIFLNQLICRLPLFREAYNRRRLEH